MINQLNHNVIIKKVNPELSKIVYEAIGETIEKLYVTGIFPTPDVSLNEIELSGKNFLELWEKDICYMFQIFDKTSNQYIGNTILNHVNRKYQMANLVYWVRNSREGEGFATEAALLAARYGFEKLGFHRIEIVVHVENKPSLRVAEKLGAVREGLLRNRLQLLGLPRDAYMHSLIPKDLGLDIS